MSTRTRRNRVLLPGFAWAFVLLGTLGCEDGPSQVYEPSPEGAGGRWNDGKSGGHADKSTGDYGSTYGGTTQNEICTADVRKARWEKAFREDIVPPRMVAGLDLAGGEEWQGLRFEDAERNALCQSNNLGAAGDTVFAGWGDNQEVVVDYNVNTGKIEFVRMFGGYTGKVTAKSDPKSRFSKDGLHTYVFQINQPVLRDGVVFRFDWSDNVKVAEQGTELFHALMYTFAPDLPRDETNCVQAGQCISRAVGEGEAVFGARGIGFYIHVPSIVAPGNGPSTPDYFYMWPVKLMPFSAADMFLKLDAEGPIATANGLGDRKVDCKLFMGQRYADFIDRCVAVTTDDALNKKTVAKLLGNLRHTDENYIFSVEGVNQDFSSEKLFTDAHRWDIIHDDWRPEADDQATEFILDVRANGKLLNEYDPRTDNLAATNAPGLFATAAIYREFAQLAQHELHAMMPKGTPKYELGAPQCLRPDDPAAPLDPAWKPAEGCTGLEGFILPSKPDSDDPRMNRISFGNYARAFFGYVTVLKPGDPKATFCSDPSEPKVSGISPRYPVDYKNPNGWSDCRTVSLWDGSWQKIVEVLGKGEVGNLPPEARDRKWFFKIWARAYVKYLLNASRLAGLTPKSTEPADLSRPPTGKPAYDEPELDELLFDDLGAENEKFEYIDRRFVDAQNEPIKFEYEVLILSGNQRDSKFHKRMTRPEKAMYRAMSTDKTAPEGKENTVLFTNMVGSKILKQGGWIGAPPDSEAKPAIPALSPYQCASTDDPVWIEHCFAAGGPRNIPPMDAAGNLLMDETGKRPLLARYPGAFGETVFSIGATHIKVEDPDEKLKLIRSAKAFVPNFADPYDPTSKNLGDLPVLVDWRAKAPTIGISIPLNGVRDVFRETFEMDFSGSSLTLLVDYLPVKIGDETRQKIVGVSSNDYLGDLFLCRDPKTGDLLRVEQYESMATILDWIEKHPGSRDACGLMVRYSPYNNYPHLLHSKAASMYVIVKQGSGYGRVSTVVAYDSSIE
jgi:hypothetical protein